MKNIKDLGEKVAIQCKTPEAFIEISNKLSGRTLNVKYWDTYKEDSCIDPSDNCWESIDWYKSQGYTIHQASDFMPLSPQDEIKELKARIATLEESLRPKKKIEFVKYLSNAVMDIQPADYQPEYFETFKKVELNDAFKYDIIEATDSHGLTLTFLGHFNDGIK